MSKKDSDREQALNLALSQIEKQYGEGAVMKMGDMSTRTAVDSISTGSLAPVSYTHLRAHET